MHKVALVIGILVQLRLSADAQTPATPIVCDVKLHLETKNNQVAFHVGELITLQLTYSLAEGTHNTYSISNTSYDRSGRLGIERYSVEPGTGWDDPLHLYFQSYTGFIVDGLSSTVNLTPTPVVISRDLNEWVRFDTPGQYRLEVVSTRVQPAHFATKSKLPPFEVRSNPILVQIVPATAQWQAEALRGALSTIDNPAVELRSVLSQQSIDRRQAVAVLRYLGTPAAAIAVADRLNDGTDNFQLMLGLAASPARDTAVAYMQQLLHDPAFPVSDMFLQAVSLVALPPEGAANRSDERSQLQEKFEKELLQSVTTKTAAASAISATTLLNAAGIRSRQLSSENKSQLATQLADLFDSLPLDAQTGLLDYHWRNLDLKIMLSILPKIAQRARLRSWHSRWKGREEELLYIPGQGLDGMDEAKLDTSLIHAIATAQSWLVNEAMLKRLLSLSVTADQRQHVEQIAEAWRKQPKTINYIPGGSGHFYIAQYQPVSLPTAIDKLKQFPIGTQFVWISDSADQGASRALNALTKTSQKSGMAITLAQGR